MCNPIPSLPPSPAFSRMWTTRATHRTSLVGFPATACGIFKDTSTGVPIPGTGAFGTINSTRSTIAMRQLQFGLKLVF